MKHNHLMTRMAGIFLLVTCAGTGAVHGQSISAFPERSSVTVSDTSLANGLCCIGKRGNIDSDSLDEINILDLSFLVSYAYWGGPPPLCMEEADLDGSSQIDMEDITFCVDYLFRGGMSPLPCELLERVYVPNQAETTVYILDAITLALVDSFHTPVVEPHFVTFTHDLEYYFILGRQVGGDIAKYRTSDNALIELITVEGTVFPTSLVTSRNDDTVYLTDYTLGPGHTHRYDISGTNFMWIDSVLQAGHQTHDIRISHDGKYVVSAGFSSDDISIINTQTGNLTPLTLDSGLQVFNPISNNYGPYGVLIDHTGTMAFLACSKGVDQIRVVDLENLTIVDSVPVPVSNTGNAGRNGPTYMTLAPNNDILFVTNYLDNTVAVVRLSTREVVATIELETPKPFGIDISRDGTRIYVSCTNTRPAPGRVYMIDTGTYQKIDSVDVGSEPFGLAVRPY